MDLAGTISSDDVWFAARLGEPPLWAVLLVLTFLVVLYLTHRSQGYPRWQPMGDHSPTRIAQQEDPGSDGSGHNQRPLARILLYFAACSLIVMAAGWMAAQTGDALATQTGLGASFIGATLLAIATSLPEVSTSVASVRRRDFEMAFSNLFGSNAFGAVLLALVPLLAGGQILFESVPRSALFAAALGIVMTCVYLWGLLERQDRAVLRMGWDSLIVLTLALVGTAAMYALQ